MSMEDIIAFLVSAYTLLVTAHLIEMLSRSLYFGNNVDENNNDIYNRYSIL